MPLKMYFLLFKKTGMSWRFAFLPPLKGWAYWVITIPWSLHEMAFWVVRVKFFLFTALNPHLKSCTSPKQSSPQSCVCWKSGPVFRIASGRGCTPLEGGWSSWRVHACLAALRLLGFRRKVKNSSVTYIVVLSTGWSSLNYNSKIHIAVILSFFSLTRDLD